MKSITIIGAGLAGTLLSLYLAARGYQVHVFESRADSRKKGYDSGRSINLAMSCRGLTSLIDIGLEKESIDLMVPMRARAIHEQNGLIHVQPFGRHQAEYINAVRRCDLNQLLLNQAEKNPNISVHFDMKLMGIDFNNKRLQFETGSHPYERLIAADGANSRVREGLSDLGVLHYTRDFLPYGYKELSISTQYTDTMGREQLHLWPRESFLLLGNPNRDGSITGSLFLPEEGETSFDSLRSEEAVNLFFKRAFPDAIGGMPNIVAEFFDNPMGNMSTIKCSAWSYEDQCLLIGDAAHGIVPFFGQGMNSAFEDCRVLNTLLDDYHDDWAVVMPLFYTLRKPNTDAVAALSMANYHEIQNGILDKQVNFKKQVEQALMHRYPDRYVSKHVLVMFSNTPYAEALAYGEVQFDFLEEICAQVNSLSEIDWKKVEQRLPDYDKKLADKLKLINESYHSD